MTSSSESSSSSTSSATGSDQDDDASSLSYKLKAGTFLAVTGGFGLFAGFAGALGQAKKQDPAGFDKGLAGAAGDPAVEAATRDAVRRLDSAALEQLRSEAALHESGAALARRALGWGTLWAVAGCGAIFLSVWSLMGVSSLAEFREKVGHRLPRIPKNPPKPGDRTEFSGINDFLKYIIEKDKEEKLLKEKRSQ